MTWEQYLVSMGVLPGPKPPPPTAAEVAAWHRERVEIETAIGMEHLRQAAAHARAALKQMENTDG